MSVRSYHAEQIAKQKRQEAESLLGFMVGEFADKLRSVKRMDLLDGISNKALEYFTNQDEEAASLFNFSDTQAEFNNRFQYAQTLEAMGEVAYSRGKTDEAFTAFENARTRLESLLKIQPNNLDVLMLAGANAFWLGQLHYDNSDYNATEPWFKRYQEYSERMYALASNDFNSIMELSYSYNSLGSLYLKQFNYMQAKQSFTQSLEFKNRALEIKPNNKNLLRDKAGTISWLASTEEHLGNFNEALMLFEQAEGEIIEMLIQYPADASLLTSLAYKQIQQSYLLSYLPDKSKAYQKAKQATETINKARLQDDQNHTFMMTYFQFLTYQLTLFHDTGKETEINNILEFIKNSKPSDRRVIDIKISLIKYLTGKNKEEMAIEILDIIDTSNVLLTDNIDINGTLLLTRINLIKAKLANSQSDRYSFCENTVLTLNKIRKKTKSIKFTYPLIQAYTCLNKSHEIEATIIPVKE
ncbi:MAG: transcriptional regulator, partial [Pseudomonadota bacterium]|nr:transcriptional regulator [Pseudomonadota bacterium]